MNQKVLRKSSRSYPNGLLRLKNPPRQIFLIGNETFLGDEIYRVAVVGSRKMTDYGRQIINRIVRNLQNRKNLAIVTGLALGVDSHVAKRAADSGIPVIAVLAVLGGGYPASNAQLYRRITTTGLVLSEYSERVIVNKGMFIMRNRIIAGIADLVVLVESDLHGGGIITVEYAVQADVPVSVVPGSMLSRQSRGCHDLLARKIKGEIGGEINIINYKYIN